MVFAPLFVPGGLGAPELVIVFLVIFLLSAPVLALIAVLLGWVGWREHDDDRVAELERKVEALEAEQATSESTAVSDSEAEADTGNEPAESADAPEDG